MEKVEKASKISGEADTISDEINAIADDLRAQLDSATDLDISIQDELSKTQEACKLALPLNLI